MTLLTGLTEAGVEVPVQVKPDGRLVAEGLMGPVGPVGPAGPVGPVGPVGPTGPMGPAASSADSCKAWINFDGTNTVAIRASHNVSSITDNGVGDYTVNFTSALSDSNYSAVITTSRDGGVPGNTHNAPVSEALSPTAYRFVTYSYGTYLYGDHSINTVAVFR